MIVKQIVLLILIIVILVIIIYSTNIKEGINDNVFTETDMKTVKDILKKYNDSVEETVCESSLKKIKNMNISSISKIINDNVDLSGCNIVDKILNSNSKNEKVIEEINKCYGNKYTAVLNMLFSLKTCNTYKNNTDFAVYIDNISKNPSISGNNTTSKSLEQYISAMEASSQINQLTAPTPSSSSSP